VPLPGCSGLLASVDALATIVAPAWPRPQHQPPSFMSLPWSQDQDEGAQCAGSVDDPGGAIFDLAVDNSEPEVH
jgi:hypothetical protein